MQLDGANNTGVGNYQNKDIWTDLSENNKNGKIEGATWRGKALVFDGVNDWVNCDISNTDYKTIETTFTFNKLDTTENQYIIGNWAGAGGGILFNSTIQKVIGQYNIGGTWYNVISQATIKTNKEYTVSLTYDGNKIRLYINGILDSEKEVSGVIKPSSEVMVIGRQPSNSVRWFNGKVYSARIYNRALTEEEIKTNYTSDQILVNGYTNADNLEYTFIWDEEIDKFTSSEVNVENGVKGTFTEITKNREYKLAVKTPDSGIVKVFVPKGVCQGISQVDNIESEIKKITVDKQGPTYSSVEIKNISLTGYDVYVYNVVDNYSGVNRVQFPTWTENNGEDDIQENWQINTIAKGTLQPDGTTWIYRVNITDHNNEYGLYNTDVYIYDNLGNCTILERKIVDVPEPIASTTINNVTTVYATVQEAIDASGTEIATVKLLKDNIEEEVTVVENQNIIFNMSGKTLIGVNKSTITNNGILTIVGDGTITTSAKVNTITNTGTLNLEHTGTISNENTGECNTITNTGTVNKTGSGVVSSKTKGYAIDGGVVNVSEGTITTSGYRGINATGNFTMTGGTVSSTNGAAIFASGNSVSISGGIVQKSTANGGAAIHYKGEGIVTISKETIIKVLEDASSTAVWNASSGTMRIEGGTIWQLGTGAAIVNNSTGIIEILQANIMSNSGNAIANYSTGKVKIQGGTITSAKADTVWNKLAGGIIEITGGEIKSESRAGVSVSNGITEIKGGSIEGKTYGVWASNGTVIIGDNSNEVGIDSPNIIGKTITGIRSGLATFNFYDGIIIGPLGKSIDGTISEIASGYVVVKGSKTIDEVTYETSVLGPSVPVVTAKYTNASGMEYTSGTWTNQSVYISLASDNIGAGIRDYQWKEGSLGTWKVGNMVTSNNIGIDTFGTDRDSTIYFRAIDNNGVISTESSIDLKIDKTVPSTTAPTAIATTNTITVTNNQTDSKSGIKTVQYAIKKGDKWSEWQNSNIFDKSDGGIFCGITYIVKTRTTDNAGNSSESAETTIKTLTYDYSIGYDLNNGTVSNNPSTYTSGIATTINAPTRTGYTFTGWSRKYITTWSSGFINLNTGKVETSSTSNFSSYFYLESGVTYTINTNYTGKIRWRAYDLNGNYIGSVSATNTYTPTSDCYIRILFYESPTTEELNETTITIGGTTKSGTISTNYRGKLQYIANWSINSYTVTYNYSQNGGTNATKTSASVKYNSAIDLTPTATKSGYTFVGWNTNKDATTKLSSLKMGTSNVTLYAIYKKEITATYHYYNNASSTETKTVYNKTTSATFTLPSIANQTVSGVVYTGRGWSTQESANATVVSGTTITISANDDYYASYSGTVEATFYYNSGNNSISSPSTTMSSVRASGTKLMNYKGTYINGNITVPTVVQNSTGYMATTYQGVSIAKNSTTIVSKTTVTTANTTYYAYYSKTVTYYYYNGSSQTSSTGTIRTLSDGSKYSNSAVNTPSPSAYDGATFKYWSSSNSNGVKVNLESTMVTSLYAYYEKTITATCYYYNGTTKTSTKATGIKSYISKNEGVTTIDADVILPKITANYTGWTKQGWTTGTSATGSVLYTEGYTISLSVNTTYYMKYYQTIAVTYNLNDADSPSSIASSTGTRHTTAYGNFSNPSIKITTNIPTKEGYRFDGWTNEAGTTSYIAGTSYTFSSSIKLYAKWTQYEAKVLASAVNPKDQYYLTLQEAINTVKGRAGTVQLLKNVTYTNALQIYPNDLVTIDLNGYTISSSADYVVELSNVCDVEIKNGTIDHTNTTSSILKGCIKNIYDTTDTTSVGEGVLTLTDVNLKSSNGMGIKNTGTLNMINGTINTSQDYCIDNDNGYVEIKSSTTQTSIPIITSASNKVAIRNSGKYAAVMLASGKITGKLHNNAGRIIIGPENGIATSSYPWIIADAEVLSAGGLTGEYKINSGTIQATANSTWYDATVTIRDGYTTKEVKNGNGVKVTLVESTSTASVSNATYSLRSNRQSENILQDDTIQQSETNTLASTEESKMIKQVKIGSVEYENLSEALLNARNYEEVVLLQDVNLKEKITVVETTKAKINLNGHKLQSKTGEILENHGIIQIIDTSGGKIVGKITNYKDLEIKGGTIIDKEEQDEEDNTEFNAQDTKSILERKIRTIDNQKGNVTISGGNVESNSNEGIVIYNLKEGNVVLKTGYLIANGSKAIGILNEEGNVGLNIDEELIKEANGNKVKEPEITLNGLNSIGIYNIGKNAYLELQHGIITAKTTIIGNITKLLDGYKVREEEIDAMMQLRITKEN